MDGTKPESNSPHDSGQYLSPTSIGGITIHPAAHLMPMMSAAEFADLKADIEANGLESTIKLVGETRETAQLVDGRNRLMALVELGIDPLDHADLIHPDDLGDPV